MMEFSKLKTKILLDDFLLEKLDGEGSRQTVVAIGVSGGKDSSVQTLEIDAYLRSINFLGQCILIHSNLGKIEHFESENFCRKLAERTRRELIIVHPKLPMLERWEQRWDGIRERFINLERVKLFTPFSSAELRFCSGEMKVSPITQHLKTRFPGKFIINAIGLRRQESKGRAAKPIHKPNEKLKSVTMQTTGIDWHPILDHSLEDVFELHAAENFPLHPAYERGNSRVSCSFCVLSSKNDLEVSLRDERNLESFRRIINLEFSSTYSFRSDLFLAEIGFDYLTPEEKERFAAARDKQSKRILIEKQIPKELLYIDNFPAFQPTGSQADKMAEVRTELGKLFDLEMKYTTGRKVSERYAELICKREEKDNLKAARSNRQAKNKIEEDLPIVTEQTIELSKGSFQPALFD